MEDLQLDDLEVGDHRYRFSRATEADLPELVQLLRDDVIGVTREVALLETYEAAFRQIDADPCQLLVSVRDERGRIAGTMQLSLIPGLSRGGALRLQIEGVRVAAPARSLGLGSKMIRLALDYGLVQGAQLAQLTSDVRRADARHFYERLGFEASHVGLKIELGTG